MKIGTRSLLFGVHALWWHGFTVALAWRRLHGSWPAGWEWIAVLLHDTGYFGSADIDGPEGKEHPEKSADLVFRLRFAFPLRRDEQLADIVHRTRNAIDLDSLVRYHSRHTARRHEQPVSKLCWPDKYSIMCEWRWFYWIRATLSGEIREFRKRAIDSGHLPPTVSTWGWLLWYRETTDKTVARAFASCNHPDDCGC